MKKLCVAVVLAVCAAGCKGQEVAATVTCEVTKAGTVDCSVQQTKGTAAIEVCWNFNVTCANGATLEAARSCGVVKDGQTTTTTIPADKLTIQGNCEGDMKAEVANMSWEAK